jgi:hypothetical protein
MFFLSPQHQDKYLNISEPIQQAKEQELSSPFFPYDRNNSLRQPLSNGGGQSMDDDRAKVGLLVTAFLLPTKSQKKKQFTQVL